MPNPSDTFLDQLPLIEKICHSVCRGRRMSRADVEDFTSFVKVRFIEKNYDIVAKFNGRSTFGTYIITVISRLLTDFRDHERGRWRNSAEAKRMGDVAMALERLLIRDKRPFDEAVFELMGEYPGATRTELEHFASRFPTRHRLREAASLEESADPSAGGGDADAVKKVTLALMSQLISAFIARLPKKDQLIVQLRFEEGMPVPRIATALGLDAQSLYRRLYKIFGDLRILLENAGMNAADVAALSSQDAAWLDFHLENHDECPSTDDEDPEGDPGGRAK